MNENGEHSHQPNILMGPPLTHAIDVESKIPEALGPMKLQPALYPDGQPAWVLMNPTAELIVGAITQNIEDERLADDEVIINTNMIGALETALAADLVKFNDPGERLVLYYGCPDHSPGVRKAVVCKMTPKAVDWMASSVIVRGEALGTTMQYNLALVTSFALRNRATSEYP